MGNTEFIHLENHPIYLKGLSKGRLLILNCDGNNDYSDSKLITLHDENYNVIKKIEEINCQSISKIEEISVNEEKRERSKYRIIVTDFELNFIKYFGSQDRRGDNKFDHPSSICFKNGFLYVCDSLNRRIHKFDQHLKLIKMLILEYKPWQLTVFNSELAVRSRDESTYVYDINSLNFKREFDNFFGFDLSEIDSTFYEVRSKEVNSFDQNGDFVETMQLDDECDDGKLFCARIITINLRISI